ADQLGSPLGPDTAALRPDPRGPSLAVVVVPSDESRGAADREGHGTALRSGPHAAGADQLGALGPDAAAPRPDPRRPSSAKPSDPPADQLGALLGPDAAAPRPDPRGPSPTVVEHPSNEGRGAVGG